MPIDPPYFVDIMQPVCTMTQSMQIYPPDLVKLVQPGCTMTPSYLADFFKARQKRTRSRIFESF